MNFVVVIGRYQNILFTICGIGGTGKNAFAKYTFNNRRTVENFDARMGVQVCRESDMSTITRRTLESATDGECLHIRILTLFKRILRKS